MAHPNLLALKREAEHKVRLRKHSLEWFGTAPSNRALQGRCKTCGFTVTVNTNSLARTPIEGPALLYHCAGQPFSFEEAQDFFEGIKAKSVLLEPDVRLVPLASDRFGIQYKNTYLIRICSNGCFIFNSSSRMNEEVARIISAYSPVRLIKHGVEWFYHNASDEWISDESNARDLKPFKDLDVVDSLGQLQPRVKAKARYSAKIKL